MQLIVVSDSHGNRKILEEIIEKHHEQVDAFVHCGDSELSSSDLVWGMMDTVSGNCDFDYGLSDSYFNHDHAFSYGMVHGHQHDIKRTLEPLKKLAKEKKVSLIFYGHSHILQADWDEGIFFLNPGSIQSPRGALREKTYCLLNVEEKMIRLTVFNHLHQELSDLSQEWTL